MLLISCNHSTPNTEVISEAVTPVTITSPAFKSVSSSVELPAMSTFLSKSIIRATTSGKIEKILVTQGDHISAGQLLFTIRTREAMALNNSNIGDTSVTFKGLININSLKDGVVSTVSYQKGDFVQEGDEMAVLSEKSSLVFLLDVPFELDKYVEKNSRCVITLPDSRHITGNITGKLADMDVQSQTIRYIVRPLINTLLPANLIASISIIESTSEKAVVLPRKAVLGNETQTEFWVMKLTNDSTAVRVNVEKGLENNDDIEITSPIFLSTDRFILTGNYGLPDTARINIIKE